MRPRVLILAAVALHAGCLRKTSYDQCKSDPDCAAAGAGFRCEPSGACSAADPLCPSGQRYHTSAGSIGGECVPGGPPADGPVDAVPLPAGRECVEGRPLPATYSACAAMVNLKEPRCGTEMWDAVCVRWAEPLCALPCSGMVFVGTDQKPVVLRLADNAVIWRDPSTTNEGAIAGAWADDDDDGDPDLAVVNDTGLRIFQNRGWDAGTSKLDLQLVYAKTWGTIDPEFPNFGATDVKWVDVDHDGDVDAVIAGNAGMVELRNDGDQVFLDQPPIMKMTPAFDAMQDSPNIIRTAWGDTDGDGYPEMALVRFAHKHLFFHNNHGEMVETHWDDQMFEFGAGVTWCNLDADPAPELVTSGYNWIILYDVVAGVPSATGIQPDSAASSDIQCADFDGDGDLDLIASGDDGIPTRVLTHNPNTVNGFSESWRDESAAAMAMQTQMWNAAVGDLDGDHKLDVIGSGHAGDPPIVFQRYTNTSIKNKVQFKDEPLTKLDAETQYARLMSIAPLVGH